ncbi:MAG TPA: NmrA family NAD(P)-binding protein [Micromonosporaceae bacterium]|nr:NmrA family NAD(P)-binding protein [Micromonosporaceae bacterium]
MTAMTLVIGGTGKTGRRVVRRLSALGVPTRIGSRAGEPPFDWQDRATWAPALDGVTAAYVAYYPDLAFAGAADTVRDLAAMAVAAGVGRLVLLSGRGETGAGEAERAVRKSGAAWTVVRCSFFDQNFSEHFLLDGARGGVLAFPAGEVREPFVDLEDVADVATAALTDDRHAGQVYEVTGPRLLTFGEAAQEIARATRRQVRYVPVTGEEYRTAMLAHGVPEQEADALAGLFAEVLDGRNASLGDGVQRALGRPPRDFAAYARDAAATGVWA